MTTTNAHALSNHQRNHFVLGSDTTKPQRTTYRDLAFRGGGELSPSSKWRTSKGSAAAAPIECTGSTNTTSSTATTLTDPSHDNHPDPQTPVIESPQMEYPDPQTPVIESAQMRSRTNFGEYSYYVPPETKASPYHSPTGPPVSPSRDWSAPRSPDGRLIQKLKPFFPTSPPQREQPEARSMPSPLDEKRLHFFDDAPVDQVPFDQVWNQHEFALDERNSDYGSDAQNAVQEGELDKSTRSDASQPFDEPQGESRSAPGFSAFSAVGTTAALASSAANAPPPPPPPPPPPVLPLQKSQPSYRHSISGPTGGNAASRSASASPAEREPTPTQRIRMLNQAMDKAEGLESRRQSPPVLPLGNPGLESRRHSSPPVVQLGNPPVLPPSNQYQSGVDDVPSDEEEKNQRRLVSAEVAQLSLATASKRTTAEDVGKKTAEDLSSAGSPRRRENGSDDEKSVDSLFDFEKQQRLLSPARPSTNEAPVAARAASPSRSPARWRKHAPANIVTSGAEDDASTTDPDEEKNRAKDLRERAHEAFASRNKRCSPMIQRGPSPSTTRLSPRKAASPFPQKVIAAVPTPRLYGKGGDTDAAVPPTKPTIPAPAPAPRVSFGPENTVHTFQHEFDMYSEHSESAAFEEKTIGSDVEDAIKDIFMIGALGACNPSPRKIRYNKDASFERRDSKESYNDSDDEDEGDKSDEDSVNAAPQQTSVLSEDVEEKLKRVATNEDSDVFYETMLSMVEGGLGAMSAWFATSSAKVGEREGTEEAQSELGNNASTFASTFSAESLSPMKDNSRSRSSRKSPPNDGAMEGVFESMSDYILGPEKSESFDDEIDVESEHPRDEGEFDTNVATKAASEDDEDEIQKKTKSLEDDPRLLELAKQSALCMHEVLGVTYDESRGVDISDVKFIVVVLSLPLGIIFQEDYSGCWITKIMPNGNADQSGKVEAGDQLAAINGDTAIGMKVDDICAAISAAAAVSKEIELTFLRYIGPFRPMQSDGAGVPVLKADEDPSIGILELEVEHPRSTMSVSTMGDSRDSKGSSTKKGKPQKSPKRGSLKKKFKWLSRGKKQQKAE